jgi:uncharacterized membrane protein YfcA
LPKPSDPVSTNCFPGRSGRLIVPARNRNDALPFLSHVDLLLAIAAAAVAGLLRGTTGFGSSLVLAPVLSTILTPTDAVAITLLIGLSASVILLPRYFGEIDRSPVGALCAWGLAFVVPGTLLLRVVSAETMRALISCTMIIISGLMIIKPHFKFEVERWHTALAGALGGAIMGATSMGGPPVVLYLVGTENNRVTLKANIVAAVGFLELAAIGVLSMTGEIGWTTFLRFAVLFPAFCLFMYFGETFAGRVVDKRFQSVVLWLLLLIGVATALM